MTEDKQYYGLDIFDLEEVIVNNRDKILIKEPLKDHDSPHSHFNEKHPREVFEQCDLCEKWIRVYQSSFGYNENGEQYHYCVLMQAPDYSNRWVCDHCHDIIDVAYSGPYRVGRPKNKPYPTHLEKMISNDK